MQDGIATERRASMVKYLQVQVLSNCILTVTKYAPDEEIDLLTFNLKFKINI